METENEAKKRIKNWKIRIIFEEEIKINYREMRSKTKE